MTQFFSVCGYITASKRGRTGPNKTTATTMQYLWSKFCGLDFDDEEVANEALITESLDETLALHWLVWSDQFFTSDFSDHHWSLLFLLLLLFVSLTCHWAGFTTVKRKKLLSCVFCGSKDFRVDYLTKVESNHLRIFARIQRIESLSFEDRIRITESNH